MVQPIDLSGRITTVTNARDSMVRCIPLLKKMFSFNGSL